MSLALDALTILAVCAGAFFFLAETTGCCGFPTRSAAYTR
jgi:hypothetical protein